MVRMPEIPTNGTGLTEFIGLVNSQSGFVFSWGFLLFIWIAFFGMTKNNSTTAKGGAVASLITFVMAWLFRGADITNSLQLYIIGVVTVLFIVWSYIEGKSSF